MTDAARTTLRRTALVPVLLALAACAPGGIGQSAPPPGHVATAQQASDILFRYDFSAVSDVARVSGGWSARAFRDGVWVPVEVRDDGTVAAQ